LSLKPADYLKDFEDHVKRTLEGDPDIKNTAVDTLNALSFSKTSDAASQITSFGLGFGLSSLGIEQYEFSGEHEYYRHTLERIYRPLGKNGLLQENENNNFTIPEDRGLHEICRKELIDKAYIDWDDFSSRYLWSNYGLDFSLKSRSSQLVTSPPNIYSA
jgi:hypothetical protein